MKDRWIKGKRLKRCFIRPYPSWEAGSMYMSSIIIYAAILAILGNGLVYVLRHLLKARREKMEFAKGINEQILNSVAEVKKESAYRDDVGNWYNITDITEQIQVVSSDYKKLFTFELANGDTIYVSTDIDALFEDSAGRRFILLCEDANEFIDRDGVIKKVIAARKIEYYDGTYDAKVLFVLETGEEVIIDYVD